MLAPLLVALGACATYYEDPRHDQQGSGGSAAMGGADAAGSSGTAGSSTVGGAGSGGVVGTAGSAAGTEMGGSAGSGDSGAAGSGGGGAGGNAGGGAGGSAGSSAGGGGKGGSGGSGGSGGGAGGSAGAAGSGGSGGGPAQPHCSDHPLSAKSKWVVTASSSDGPAPPAQAVDGDLGTRWSTGKEQMGGEWLQIDFGAVVSLTRVTLVLGSSVNDYPRKYATRFSSSSQDTAAPVLASGMGAASTDTVMNFPKGSSGRYVLISQSGTAPALWWSVAEVLAACAD